MLKPVVKMTVEEWEEQYKPIVNHLDANASWASDDSDGIMFETYGAEVDYVYAQPLYTTWTYVDGQEGTYILAGRHLVNRIGYFITEVTWEHDFNTYYEIQVASNQDMYATVLDLEGGNQ
jgi:hypothetical protein